TCDYRFDQNAGTGRASIRHCLRPDRYWQCDDRDGGPHDAGRAPAGWVNTGRGRHGCRACGGCSAAYGEPAVGDQCAVHDRDGDKNAICGSGLTCRWPVLEYQPWRYWCCRGWKALGTDGRSSAECEDAIMTNLQNWTPRSRPQRLVLEGRYVKLEPLDAARHGDALYEASRTEDRADRFRWLYDDPP